MQKYITQLNILKILYIQIPHTDTSYVNLNVFKVS
jgi:hypothetical protein